MFNKCVGVKDASFIKTQHNTELLEGHFKLFVKEPKINFSFSAGFFNGKRHEEFHGQELRTWLDDVGEVLLSNGSESLVHVLQKYRHDEEAGFEPFGMGVCLPFQQFECLPLVVVLDDDLFNHCQDPDAETASWDYGNFFLFPGCV